MFEIDQRILDESHLVAELKFSTCLMVRDQDLPWFMLIPRVESVTEFYQLTPGQQIMLNQEMSQLSKLLQEEFKVDKINMGMIGNMVPQLHVHIIGRFKDDRLFPKPVWGFREETPFEDPTFQQRLEVAKKFLA